MLVHLDEGKSDTHSMKNCLYPLIILSVVALCSFEGFGQSKRVLPGNLNQNSTVSEILTWLDQTTFRNMRVVLKDSWDVDEYIPPLSDYERAKNSFNFTRGFRATTIGCNLVLRNDDASIVTKGKVEETAHPLIADVWVQLNRMGADKGRHTYRYTKDKKKVRLLGAWRTEFSYNGWFSRTMVGLTLSSPQWKEPQHWEGLNLAFTFDTREMGEQFDAAFRQAIRLCRKK
jgi:hypothetical protein